MDIDTRFHKACKLIESRRSESNQIDIHMLSHIYGLYKCATAGIPDKTLLIKNPAKYQAWVSAWDVCGGSRQEAKELYVELCSTLP